jgi:hypothetical protein
VVRHRIGSRTVRAGSDATVYAIYGSFLVGAWIIPGVKRLRKVADESELERAAVLIDEASGQAYN